MSGRERSPTAPIRVLQVVSRAGGGLLAAVEDHVSNTPAFDHHVLIARELDWQPGDQLEDVTASIVDLPDGHLARIRAIRARVEELQPDVVHAHSSFAGFYVRIALGSAWRERIVYTPHCYAFLRRDINAGMRAGFWVAEAALGLRNRHVAACSPLEARVASRFPGKHRVRYVPNVARGYEPGPRQVVPADGEPMIVATVGRVTAAKGPDVYTAAASLSRDRGLPIEWWWIGGGDADGEVDLRRAGVDVTGWITRAAALARMEAAHVYVHTAAWEGAPITILEAALANIPVVARRTRALDELGVRPLYDTVDELLDILMQFPDGPAIQAAFASLAELRERHRPELQRAALEDIYRAAAGMAR
jgi:glycosyltransferase involved in cell wall biosynthesis